MSRYSRSIDIMGQDGNAWVLIANASSFAKQLGKDAKAITKEMQSGDYINLLDVFKREFPFCELVGYDEYVAKTLNA